MDEVVITRNPDPEEIRKKGIDKWPVWEKEASEFEWYYDTEETCYIITGRVTVVTQDGDTYEFGKGDIVTFKQGLSCTWRIHEDVRKHYRLG